MTKQELISYVDSGYIIVCDTVEQKIETLAYLESVGYELTQGAQEGMVSNYFLSPGLYSKDIRKITLWSGDNSTKPIKHFSDIFPIDDDDETIAQPSEAEFNNNLIAMLF